MTLDQLKIGASGTITSVGGDGPLRCRLLDMGLIPRTRGHRYRRSPPWETPLRSASGAMS